MVKAPSRGRKRGRGTPSQTASRKTHKERKNKKKSGSRKRRARATPWRRRLLLLTTGLLLAAVLVAGLVIMVLDRTIVQAFEGRRWDVPAHVYAQPLELYEGRTLDVAELELALVQLGYQRRSRAAAPGTYARSRSAIELVTRPFRFWDGSQAGEDVFVRFSGGRISWLGDAAQRNRKPIVRLDPLLVGSLFPGVVEDRLVIAPGDVPQLLREALLAVEDRRFYAHHGLDVHGIARAVWVNLRAGRVRQGGSTLTQQLVKSYFLDSSRTLRRKLIEAVMAVLLERRYDKDALLNAYINEIYLGQDGARAIHGFALASRFYFGRPLAELEPAQLALLVAMVRGPSHYDPRRFPERARARRDLVLRLMGEGELLRADQVAEQTARGLGLADKPVRGASYFPAFMSLVRQQLVRDYDSEDLARKGLQIFTTLDPLVQARAERALAGRIAALEKLVDPGLEGALVVTTTDGAEILAAVGGRDPFFDGFNRVLDAKRPVGSLLKPFVYLAALEKGGFNFATELQDSPFSITLDDGKVWAPGNYDGAFVDSLPAVRALAESRNVPAVRLGMATGVAAVADMLARLGFGRKVQPYPSLLLGAIAMSPLEVAQLYNVLATGGALAPLRSVRFVLAETGEQLGRYPLRVRQEVTPGSVTQLNAALLTAMRRGTGRSARSRLPPGLEVAGKTGTTDELRDSWFAGFSADHLAVVWIGRDDNLPAGLSGAAGALAVWTDLFAGLPTGSLVLDLDDTLRVVWLDYQTGLESRPDCGDTVPLPVPASTQIEAQPGCGPTRERGVGEKALDWFRDVIG